MMLSTLTATGQRGDGRVTQKRGASFYLGIKNGEVDVVGEREGDRFRGTWGGAVRHGNGFRGRGLRHVFVNWLAMLCENKATRLMTPG